MRFQRTRQDPEVAAPFVTPPVASPAVPSATAVSYLVLVLLLTSSPGCRKELTAYEGFDGGTDGWVDSGLDGGSRDAGNDGGGDAGPGADPIVVGGGPVTGSLPPGQGGVTTHPMEVAGSTWHRVTASADNTIVVHIYMSEPFIDENMAVMCFAPYCIVDFVTVPSGGTYIAQISNGGLDNVQYQVNAVTLPIPDLIVDDPTPAAGSVTGKASDYYRFEVLTARNYVATLQVGAGTSTPLAVKLFDEAGVVLEAGVITFVWTDDPASPAEMDELISVPGTYYLKVHNLPNPMEVDDGLTVDYTLHVTSY